MACRLVYIYTSLLLPSIPASTNAVVSSPTRSRSCLFQPTRFRNASSVAGVILSRAYFLLLVSFSFFSFSSLTYAPSNIFTWLISPLLSNLTITVRSVIELPGYPELLVAWPVLYLLMSRRVAFVVGDHPLKTLIVKEKETRRIAGS